MKANTACFYWLFVAACSFVISNLGYHAPGKVSVKKTNIQRYEDYTFDGLLARAKEECSYMSLLNDTLFRNRTLQMVKEKIARKTVQDFYRRKETEKKRAKEFYQRVEEQSRRRVLSGGGPPPHWEPSFPPPGPVFVPPAPPLLHLHKRSAGSHPLRRKGSSPLGTVSFTDHNNCSSRCLFARMEMVDSYGFPEESLISKLIEDRIPNRTTRLLKMKKVASCFKKMDEVAFDDSCIFSSRLFECLDLGEQSSWSGLR